jgi:hypothetical protein
MPIYEYYCPNHNKIYQFYAKTLAQGQTVPKCPDNPSHTLAKLVSPFAVRRKGSTAKEGGPEEAPSPAAAGEAGAGEDPRMDAAMASMESEFANVDENDPRAMGRMMRRMAELTGEKIDGEMEEVVRKLEEGADPDSLEDQLGGEDPGAEDPDGEGMGGPPPATDPKEPPARPRVRRPPPARDPKLYDYE